MGEEIIANKKAKEDEIINDSFKIKGEWQMHIIEFQIKIFSNDIEFYELELDCSCYSSIRWFFILILWAVIHIVTLLTTS